MQNKPLITVIVATVITALLSFLNYSPDPQAVSDVVAYADQAKAAISTRNWISLGTVLVSFSVWAYAWYTSRKKSATALSMLLALAGITLFFSVSTIFRPAKQMADRSSRAVRIIEISTFPRPALLTLYPLRA